MAASRDVVRILHVDDDPQFAELAAQLLVRQDDRFEVVSAPDAVEGEARLGEGDFDCVVSDYEMPERDGLAFLERVREEHPDLPFVLFTGKGSEEIASEAISAGVTDYLQKGTGTDQYALLANRIQNAVERYRAVRQMGLGHRAMETAHEGMSLVEPDGTFSYVNPAFAGLFGYEPDELIGEHWKVLYHDQEAVRLEEDILPAVAETGYWSGETVRLTKRGDRLVTDHRLAASAEDAIVCTAKDLTDERVAPDGSTTGFDLLVDAMEDHAFYTLDHEGYVTRWNEGAEHILGYEASEIVGEHLSSFFAEEDRDHGVPERLVEAAKADGSATHEGWRVRKDGSRFWADATLSASYDDNGTLRGFGQMMRESTRRPIEQ